MKEFLILPSQGGLSLIKIFSGSWIDSTVGRALAFNVANVLPEHRTKSKLFF